MKATLGRFFDGLILAMAWLGAACIAFVLIVVSAGAISRFFFHQSLTWTTELTEYALLYTTFLLAPYVLKQDRHVRVDIILNVVKKRSPRAVAVMEILGNVLGFVIFGIIGYYGVLVTVDNFVRKVQNPTTLQFPKGVLLLGIPWAASAWSSSSAAGWLTGSPHSGAAEAWSTFMPRSHLKNSSMKPRDRDFTLGA